MRIEALSASLLAIVCVTGVRAETPALETGTARFRVVGEQKNVPERYRLEDHAFDWEMQPKQSAGTNGVTIYHVRFPSPVETETKENNIVHAEYYRPKGDGPFPATIVLDVTAGDQQLSRIMSMHLASKGVAALFVQMAYYGPRRPAGSDLRLLSPNVPRTLDAIRQTVLDLRRASAWLEGRKEVDAQRLGITGTSLGSFLGALTAEMEPRLGRVVVLLGGGGLVDGYWDDPRGEPLRQLYRALGGNKERLKEIIAPVDPLTCAANLKDRKVLILAAKRDDIVPPRCAEALWEATGKQKIVWFDATHYSAALYIIPALNQIAGHLQN
ncbi:MAG: alpha/beta hydrolase family protein [Planctomycetia bacterium]|nr:alpha/beta hydrolase family protein [Planctomycetia bacterium]